MGAAAQLHSVPIAEPTHRRMSLVAAVETGDRETVLRVLACRIAGAIDTGEMRGPALAALSRSLLAIVRELEGTA